MVGWRPSSIPPLLLPTRCRLQLSLGLAWVVPPLLAWPGHLQLDRSHPSLPSLQLTLPRRARLPPSPPSARLTHIYARACLPCLPTRSAPRAPSPPTPPPPYPRAGARLVAHRPPPRASPPSESQHSFKRRRRRRGIQLRPPARADGGQVRFPLPISSDSPY